MDFASHSSHLFCKKHWGGTKGRHLRECTGNGHIFLGVNTLRLSRTEIGVRGFLTPIPDTDPLTPIPLTPIPVDLISDPDSRPRFSNVMSELILYHFEEGQHG